MATAGSQGDHGGHIEVQGSSERTFGLVLGCFLVIVACWPWLHGRPLRTWAFVVGLALGLLGWGRPSLLSAPNRWWMRLGLLLGKVVNPVILAALFFLVFTPVALLLRLFGRDPLRLRPDPGSDSYWLARQPPGPAPDTMSHQF